MKEDPIVAEVRRIRQEHAARFGYDLDLIVADLKAQEQASGRQYIRSEDGTTGDRLAQPSAARLSSALRTTRRCWG
ncbi:MAG: hypothetical protein J4F35_15725 [Candidatus Latescibacteria bacterium]|nr:hypothetical protein [Candidatus Latescibacterota bacterium]